MFLLGPERADTSTRGAAAVAPDAMFAACIGNRFTRIPGDTPTDAQDSPADVRGRTGPFGTRRVGENAPPFRRHGKSNFSQRHWRHGQEIGKRTGNEPCNRKLRNLGSDEDGDLVKFRGRGEPSARATVIGRRAGNDEAFHSRVSARRAPSRDETRRELLHCSFFCYYERTKKKPRPRQLPLPSRASTPPPHPFTPSIHRRNIISLVRVSARAPPTSSSW